MLQSTRLIFNPSSSDHRHALNRYRRAQITSLKNQILHSKSSDSKRPIIEKMMGHLRPNELVPPPVLFNTTEFSMHLLNSQNQVTRELSLHCITPNSHYFLTPSTPLPVTQLPLTDSAIRHLCQIHTDRDVFPIQELLQYKLSMDTSPSNSMTSTIRQTISTAHNQIPLIFLALTLLNHHTPIAKNISLYLSLASTLIPIMVTKSLIKMNHRHLQSMFQDIHDSILNHKYDIANTLLNKLKINLLFTQFKHIHAHYHTLKTVLAIHNTTRHLNHVPNQINHAIIHSRTAYQHTPSLLCAMNHLSVLTLFGSASHRQSFFDSIPQKEALTFFFKGLNQVLDGRERLMQ